MPSLRAVKTRINNVDTVEKVTQSIKLVATSKLAKMKSFRSNYQDYLQSWGYLTQQLLLKHSGSSIKESAVMQKMFCGDGHGKSIVIFVASDRGLCGSYNHSVFQAISAWSKAQRDNLYKIIPIGRKAYNFAKSYGDKRFELLVSSEISQLDPMHLDIIAKYIMYSVRSEGVEVVHLFSTKNVNLLHNVILQERLLPLETDSILNREFVVKGHELAKEPWIFTEDTDFADSAEIVFENYFKYMIYRSLVNSLVAEYSSRVTAMDNANSNAKELLDKLSLEYNKNRQSNVTRELLEIISGSEAL